jgi:hypothetical protein
MLWNIKISERSSNFDVPGHKYHLPTDIEHASNSNATSPTIKEYSNKHHMGRLIR